MLGSIATPALRAAGDPPAILPLDQVKPGMRGTAYTIFAGDKIEPFDIDAGLQTGQQDPSRATGNVEHRTVCRSCESRIEIEPAADVFADQIVDFAIIEN